MILLNTIATDEGHTVHLHSGSSNLSGSELLKAAAPPPMYPSSLQLHKIS